MNPTLLPALPARVAPGAAVPSLHLARWSLAALFFSNGAVFANWAARVPAVQAKLELSHGALGNVLLAAALGAVVAMPAAGWLVHRYGCRTLSRVLSVLNCLSLPWLALAPNVPLLAAALFCFGAGHGAMDVAINAQAVAVERRFGRPIMSSFHALWSVGGLTGAAGGGLLAAGGVGLVAHFTGAALVLGALVLSVSPHLWPARNDGEEETAKPDGGDAGAVAAAGEAAARGRRLLLTLGLVTFCVLLGEGAMADWGAVFLRRSLGTGEGLAAAGYAAFSLAMAAGRFGGDATIARLGPVRTTRLGGALAAAGMAFALGVNQPWSVLVGFALVGAGFATVVPIAFSAAGRLAGVAPGVAISAVSTAGYFGFLVGPPLIGRVAEWSSLRLGLGVIGFLSALTALLAPAVGGGSGGRREDATPGGAVSG